MTNHLDDLEREMRRTLRRHVALLPPPSLLLVAAAAFVVTPFALVAGLFVPLLGQLLAALAALASAAYLYSVRSIRVTAAGMAGAACSAFLFWVAMASFRERAAVLWYSLFGLSVGVTIAYIIGVTGALWARNERGACGAAKRP